MLLKYGKETFEKMDRRGLAGRPAVGKGGGDLFVKHMLLAAIRLLMSVWTTATLSLMIEPLLSCSLSLRCPLLFYPPMSF